MKKNSTGIFKCSVRGCKNRYDDVVGRHVKKSGAECIPCFLAGGLLATNKTPADIRTFPQAQAMFDGVLSDSGWEWKDLEDSYERMTDSVPAHLTGGPNA